MHQASSSCVGTGRPSFSSAYWIEPVMPGFGSVSVPSRSKKMVSMVSFYRRRDRLVPADRHLAGLLPTEGCVKRPSLPRRVKNGVAEAELTGPSLRQRHQLLRQALAAVFRLHEAGQDIGAVVVGR